MKQTPSMLAENFYKGDYALIVQGYEDGAYDQLLAQKSHEYVYLMGAYSFLGKLSETERLLHKLIEHRLDLSTLSRCQFYYVLLLTRLSHYQDAREQILRLLSRRNHPDNEARFYGLQALSFYRYYQGRYQDSLAAATKALKLARGPYESFLAKDLLGHIHCQQGFEAMGENYFQGAMALARSFHLKGFQEMVAVSTLGYQIERAENLPHGREELLKKLQNTPLESFYARSGLMLTLAKIYRLQGDRERAHEYLNEASLTIFRHHNRRHMALLYLNIAYLDMYAGSFGRALQLLEVGLAQLEAKMDFSLQLKLKGLKLKILKKLKIAPKEQVEALEQEVELLTHKVGTKMALRILARERGQIKTTSDSDDSMADLLDRFKSDNSLASLSLPEWEKIYENQLLSLIDDSSEALAAGEKTMLIIGRIPKSFIVGKKGQYHLQSKGVSAGSLNFFKLLYEKKRLSKEELTTELYGLNYHPLHHDPLIHGLVARVRKQLGPYHGIIQNEEGHYIWPSNCDFIDCSQVEVSPSEPERQASDKQAIDWQLNIRQHRLLERARRGELEAITPAEYRELFQVSRITATRDLGELCERGFLAALGKARSITYIYSLRDS